MSRFLMQSHALNVGTLQAFGFDAVDLATTPTRQIAVARARSAEHASSFSMR